MKCEMCHQNEATVHLTQVVDGEVRKLHLCEQCAEQSGVDIQNPVSIADLFLGLGAAPLEPAASSGAACPRCHMTRADFKKTGRLGCPSCYEFLGAELAPLLKAMHRGDRHVGKRPAAAEAAARAGEQLAELRRRLEQAVAAEQYELAAKLRDEIRKLTGPEAGTPGSTGETP